MFRENQTSKVGIEGQKDSICRDSQGQYRVVVG